MKRITVLSLSLLALGCSKNSNITTENSTSSKTYKTLSSTTSLVDPSNSANPYDYVGVQVKADIEYVASNLENVTDQSERNAFCSDFLTQRLMSGGVYSAEVVADAISDDDMTKAEFSSYLDNQPVSLKYKGYLLSMFDLANINSGTLYSSFKASFVNIENAIINDNSLANSEKVLLLSMASCERFMYGECIDPASNGSSPTVMVPWCSRKVWRPLESRLRLSAAIRIMGNAGGVAGVIKRAVK